MTEHFLDLFAEISREIEAKRMFGGVGFYHEGKMFALSESGVLYLKTTAESRSEFETRGSAPFQFTRKDGKVTVTSYWRAPDEAMQNPSTMRPWAERALSDALARRNPHVFKGPPRQRG